jgi:hypothetical protein
MKYLGISSTMCAVAAPVILAHVLCPMTIDVSALVINLVSSYTKSVVAVKTGRPVLVDRTPQRTPHA